MTRSLFLAVTLLATSLVPTLAEDAGFSQLAEPYARIWRTLSSDSADGLAEPARALASAAKSLTTPAGLAALGIASENHESAKRSLSELATAAESLAGAKDIAKARDAFYAISLPLVRVREWSKGERPSVAFCPHAKRSWLQPRGKLLNPYYGAEMLHCGAFVSD